MNCESCQQRLSAFLDGELSADETREVNEHLIRCERCRTEHDSLAETLSTLDLISFEEPEDRALKDLWKSPYTRWQRNAGLVMVTAGYACLLLYALFEFLRAGQVPVFPKVAGMAVLTGFVLLLLLAIRERVWTRQTDRYKEVKR